MYMSVERLIHFQNDFRNAFFIINYSNSFNHQTNTLHLQNENYDLCIIENILQYSILIINIYRRNKQKERERRLHSDLPILLFSSKFNFLFSFSGLFLLLLMSIPASSINQLYYRIYLFNCFFLKKKQRAVFVCFFGWLLMKYRKWNGRSRAQSIS